MPISKTAGWVLIVEGCLFLYWLLIDTWHLHFLWYILCLADLLLLISVQCFYKCRLLPNCKGCMPDTVCLWRQTLWPQARGFDVIGRLYQHHRHAAHAKLGNMTSFNCHGFAKDVKRLLWFKRMVLLNAIMTCSYKSSEHWSSLLTAVQPSRRIELFS